MAAVNADRVLADLTLVAHAAFIVFVVLGAMLVARWPRLLWVHLPCAAWGAAVEAMGWICPLTPLENRLRARAGEAGYGGGFVERYLLPAVYPEGLTREVQIGLGVAVVAINVAAYAWLRPWRRRRSER